MDNKQQLIKNGILINQLEQRIKRLEKENKILLNQIEFLQEFIDTHITTKKIIKQ